MPPSVVSVLADDHLDEVAFNPSLSGAERVARHHPKLPAELATRLCRFPFSGDEAAEILRRDRRKGVLLEVIRSAPPETSTALMTSPRADVRAEVVLNAERYFAYDEPTIELLLGHLGALPDTTAIVVMVSATPEQLSDAAVLERLSQITLRGCNRRALNSFEWEAGKLLAFRPGLVALGAERGFPDVAVHAAAMSPWLPRSAVPALREAAGSLGIGGGHRVDAELSTNPWIRLGSDAPLIDVAPVAATPEQFGPAWAELMRVKSLRSCQVVPLLAALATSPGADNGTRSRSEEIERLLIECCSGQSELPDWMFSSVIRALPERLERIGASTWAYHQSLDETDSEAMDDSWLVSFLASTPANRLGSCNTPYYQPMFDWLAAQLGDDPDVWRTALLLIDQFDGLLPELVELAHATVTPEPAGCLLGS
jgi:hypothetical protein